MRKIANIIVLIDSNISSEAEGQIHFQKRKNFKNNSQVFFYILSLKILVDSPLFL